MFIDPNLKKGNTDLRVRVTEEMAEMLQAIAIGYGVNRSDLVLSVLDQFIKEISNVSRVTNNMLDSQRKRSGSSAEKKK